MKLKAENHIAKPAPLLLPSRPSADDRLSELKELMNFFDMDGDGKISPTELQNCMRIIGEELSLEDAEDFIMSMDSDGDGQLCFDELIKIARIEEEREEEKRKYLLEAFKVYGEEGEGYITPRSLKKTLDRLGNEKSIEECEEMIRRFDVNGDGVIGFDEFEIMML